MNNFLDILPFIQNLAQQVGDRLLQDFEQARVAITKDDGSLVTNSDRWADAYIKNALAQEFPEFGILTEESSRVLPDCDWTWVIDPLDGTTNFARGIPIWGISIGLLYCGTPVFGYVSMPPLRQNVYGWLKVAGLGEMQSESAAFLNGVPIHRSEVAPDPNSLNNYFFSVCSRSLERMGRSKFPFKLRILGAASYNLLTVALGSTIGAVEATPKIWDIAAAWVILKAVGAVWKPLEADNIFPLQFGKDYSDSNFPTLVVSHTPILSITKDLVQPISFSK
ncbi:MAG: inositol monophosphatase [Pseudanabaena sp.]|nr:MAG: inositol monophosphatase [Pseudanabaena sp.]